MNIVILRGNVGKDPVITNFEGGGKVAQFTLATTEKGFTKSDGTKVEDITDWHQCAVKRSGLAGICEQYVKKGTPILVKGKLRPREYMDNNGLKRYVTEVIVEEMELLSGKKPEAVPAPTPDGYQPSKPASNPGGSYTPLDQSSPAPANPEEDLPF